MLRLNSILFLSCSFLGCVTATEDVAPAPDGKADGTRFEVPMVIGACEGLGNDDVEVARAEISGDHLLVDATYAGSWDHDFTACWDGGFLESFPPQVTLKLYQQPGADRSERRRTTALSIELTAIANGYKSAYRENSGEVVVSLDDFSDTYEFTTLTASQLKTRFQIAARDAIYMSETDSEPTWLSTTAGAVIDEDFIMSEFGAAMGVADGSTMELEHGQAVGERLARWSEYDTTDDDAIIDSAKAFGRIKTLLESNLTELTFARIGTATPDGTLATDAGTYQLVVLGKTIDGKVVGFFVVSVET
ncbi:MAG: hypothetical protein SFX73_23910 [Kofleriaceae bacterium]|nr:hypothetical protein [Kofleriaceae bacterium]